MKTSMRACLAVMALTLGAGIGAAGAAVSVTFVKPENYADMALYAQDREKIFNDLRAHFSKLGSRLPPGQNLTIEVLDLQLAGRPAYSRRGQEDFRIMRGGADWPSMQLRYTLEANGVVLHSGEERLSDLDYLGHGNFLADSSSLRFEKHMIDEWFKKKFLTATARGERIK